MEQFCLLNKDRIVQREYGRFLHYSPHSRLMRVERAPDFLEMLQGKMRDHYALSPMQTSKPF